MSASRSLLLASVAFALASCNTAPTPPPAIGEAFAGPATMSLRADIDPKSSEVAKARHGDRLEIVAQRRRWYKVRTAKGIEGWTSDRDLLDPDQMKRLRALAAETAGMPSQGKATVFASVNVHIEPSRQATSFIQVEPKETFDVIAHRVVERLPAPKRQLVPPRPKPEKKARKEKASTVPTPPAPAPPAPPPDWLDLSKTDADPDLEPAPDAPPAHYDDFTLIRTADGQSGWVVTNALYLKIPDEVAQYAEGHRITSYFAIGKVVDKDEDEPKNIWLWTTSERLGVPYDFDGFRVFTWNLRRHRYETAYIQRREAGYFPVEAQQGRFSVCIEKDGARVRREYTLTGNSVRAAGEKPCPAQTTGDPSPAPEFALNLKPSDPGAASSPGLLAKLRTRWNQLRGRKPE